MSKKAIVAILVVILFIIVPGSTVILAVLLALGVLAKFPIRLRRWLRVFCKKITSL
jgi:hypothetical protein